MGTWPTDGTTFRFSTDAIPARECADFWRECFGRAVAKVAIEPLSPRPFRAEANGAFLSSFALVHVSTSANHAVNSPELIADDAVSLIAGPNSPWRVFQPGRGADLQPGDAALLSRDRVRSAITLWNDCSLTSFCIARSAITPLVPDIESRFARRIPSANPALRMLLRYAELARDEDVLTTPELRRAFTTHVLDLLALALGATRDAAELAKARGVRAARLEAIKEDIRKGLGRPDLSVRSVAALHGVTPRYIQLLFEESGTTFTAFVLEQRLAAARRALCDVRLASVPVGAIAFECGFGDLSYFNRAFRRRFGCTPTDARSAMRN